MRDERISRYAELLVDTCLGVQPGWQVVVYGTPEGRPLIEEIVRTIGRRDAYALLRVTFGGNAGGPRQWVAEAPLERLREAPPPSCTRFCRQTRSSSSMRPRTPATRRRSVPTACRRCRRR